MLKRLVRNTLLTGVAFVGAAVLGLLVTPIIIRTWGVAEFGLVVLARLLLPTGLMALLDFGIAEVTTQVVARAREHRNWAVLGREISFLFLVGSLNGLVICGVVWWFAELLVNLFGIGPDHAVSFKYILWATALANLLLMPALVADGVYKGFEKYGVLRWSEVATSSVFVAATVVLAWHRAPYWWVAYAYLVVVVLRASLFLGLAANLLRRNGVLPGMADRATRAPLVRLGWLIMQGRLISSAQYPAQPFIAGALFGPAAVGLYDALVKLPRFAKTVASLLTSALLPVVSRLEQTGQEALLRRAGASGAVILPFVTLPPLAAAAVLSPEILLYWIGPSLSVHGSWMGIMFLVPISSQFLLVGNVLALSRPHALVKVNRLAFAQLLVWAAVAAAGLSFFAERALILGQAVGAVVVLPFQLAAVAAVYQIDRKPLFRRLVRQVAVVAVVALALAVWRHINAIESPLELCVDIAVFCAVAVASQWFFVLKEEDRVLALQALRMVIPSRGNAA